MSREIKFRFWSGKSFNGGAEVWIGDGYCGLEEQVWPRYLEQYTGLKDKRGKEIYDGDIISADTEVLDLKFKGKSQAKTVIGPIHFHHSYWAIGDFKLFIFDDETLEILGNIHENKDLLK